MLEPVYKTASDSNLIGEHLRRRSHYGYPIVKETGAAQGWYVPSEAVREVIGTLQNWVSTSDAGEALQAALDSILQQEKFMRGNQ